MTEYHELEDVEVLNVTHKGAWIRDGAGTECFVPSSLLHPDSVLPAPGQTGTIEVERWFCEREGIE